jgi:hypothetical protein
MLQFLAILPLCAALPAQVETRARGTDLQKLQEWIELERSFSEPRRAEAHAAVASHLENDREFSDAAFYLEVRRIVALADNGHSNVDDQPIFERFGLLPVRAHRFGDGLYVVRARQAQRALLGMRIERVEGRTLAELEPLLKVYCGGTLEYFRHYDEAQLLLSPALMHAAGLAQQPDRLRLSFAQRSGEALEVVIETDPDPGALGGRPWRLLSPRPIEGAEDWLAVHPADASVPLWLQEEAEVFRYAWIEGGSLAYVQFRANRDSGSKSIHEFTAGVRQRLERDRPQSIVLDCRANGGGDLTTTADFALELPSYVQPGGRVYVLTGNGTFSAGIYTSFYAKASDPENTVVVGEMVGDRPEFWAEAGAPFQLPDSGYFLGYALQRHDLVRGCTVPQECHMTRYAEHWNLVVETLAPDWQVPLTFADFLAGRDPVLDRVLADLAARR